VIVNPQGQTKTSVSRSANKPIVKLTDVTKIYVMGHSAGGGGLLSRRTHMTTVTVHALRGVSVEFYPGEYVAIMGASGSGKSTMLNLLGCLDRPTSGEYFLGGRDVSGLNDDELSEIRSRYLGFIFQSYNLVQQYTVLENIQLPLTYQGSGEISKEAAERSVEVAGLVGLGDRLDHRPNQLSGGQQQRVAIARSLINDPYIILADEPTGNLDTTTSHEIMGMLEKMNDSGKTIIMVTHEDDIAANAKRIIRMRDGLIIDDGPSPRMQQANTARASTAASDGVGTAWGSEFNPNDSELGRPDRELAH
jgi:putative ABC transport system ATP-binding protein